MLKSHRIASAACSVVVVVVESARSRSRGVRVIVVTLVFKMAMIVIIFDNETSTTAVMIGGSGYVALLLKIRRRHHRHHRCGSWIVVATVIAEVRFLLFLIVLTLGSIVARVLVTVEGSLELLLCHVLLLDLGVVVGTILLYKPTTSILNSSCLVVIAQTRLTENDGVEVVLNSLLTFLIRTDLVGAVSEDAAIAEGACALRSVIAAQARLETGDVDEATTRSRSETSDEDGVGVGLLLDNEGGGFDGDTTSTRSIDVGVRTSSNSVVVWKSRRAVIGGTVSAVVFG